MRKVGLLVMGLVLLSTAAQAADVTLILDVDYSAGTWSTWVAVGGLADNGRPPAGVASFMLTYPKTPSVHGWLAAPAIIVPDHPELSAGWSRHREVKLGQMNAGQPTIYGPSMDNDPAKDALVIQGVGAYAGSYTYAGQTVTWGYPALLGYGTFTEDVQSMNVTGVINVLAQVSDDGRWMGPGNVDASDVTVVNYRDVEESMFINTDVVAQPGEPVNLGGSNVQSWDLNMDGIYETNSSIVTPEYLASLGLMPGGSYTFAAAGGTSPEALMSADGSQSMVSPADIDFGTLTIVPEPATLALLSLGAVALVRRRK